MKYRKIMCVLVLTACLAGVIVADDADTTTETPATNAPVTEADMPQKSTTYAFAFETENGQVRDEKIKLMPETASSKMEVNVKGSYSFISADGYEYTVFYKADKRGFRPYVTAHKITAD